MNYTLKRNKRSKHIRLRIDDAGQVIATAPVYVPKFIVTQFVNKSGGWIQRQQKRQSLKRLAFPVLDWEQRLLSYKGKLYYIKFEPNQDQKVVLGSKFIHIHPVTKIESDIRKTLLQWLQKQAESYIQASLINWSNIMQLTYNQVRFRQQKSRWGSCSSQGNLNFNWRLIHFSEDVIDYVVIHELTHLVHHNHSRHFWQYVASYEPNYKQLANFLKNQQITIEKF